MSAPESRQPEAAEPELPHHRLRLRVNGLAGRPEGLVDAGDHQVGTVLKAGEVFKDVPAVDVTGTSKGRGTAGPMKRHNFAGLPASHGVKKHHRAPGSVGSHASNRGSGRPKRGKRMAGRYGAERVTSRNLKVIKIDADNHLILVRGAVPGPNGGLIMIRATNKKK